MKTVEGAAAAAKAVAAKAEVVAAVNAVAAPEQLEQSIDQLSPREAFDC